MVILILMKLVDIFIYQSFPQKKKGASRCG